VWFVCIAEVKQLVLYKTEFRHCLAHFQHTIHGGYTRDRGNASQSYPTCRRKYPLRSGKVKTREWCIHKNNIKGEYIILAAPLLSREKQLVEQIEFYVTWHIGWFCCEHTIPACFSSNRRTTLRSNNSARLPCRKVFGPRRSKSVSHKANSGSLRVKIGTSNKEDRSRENGVFFVASPGRF